MAAGLIAAVAMILMSPVLHPENPEAALIPLKSPGIVSIPVGFVVMLLVSLATQPKGEQKVEADRTFDRVRFQATTGIDAREVDKIEA